MNEVAFLLAKGKDILPWIPDAAGLRISVFREYPYLYEGSMAYEEEYLATYAGSPDSLFVVARAGGQTIGVSSGVPLIREPATVQEPFVSAGIPPAEVFYFGESVLLAAWRGRGIGVRFFVEREEYARSLPEIRLAAFCAVNRPVDHPLRPAGYQPLDDFWQHRGFQKTGMETSFTWQETGEASPSPKALTFWTKRLSVARENPSVLL